ncbi:MAG: hypothetical protein HZB51_16305 [Chloroflexi bacterium]|nr:hypothetical protein [Chloroflexota bacterium]
MAQSIRLHNTIGSTSSQEIDVELFAFIERYATSLIRWDLLLYFGQNPNRRDQAFEVAQRMGRKLITLQKELDDLVYLGVLRVDQKADTLFYSLAHDVNTRHAAIRMARDVSITR